VRLALLMVSLTLTLGLAEIAARWALVQSHDFAPTLASERWMERYWHPVNRFGVRDSEWDPEALAATRTLFVVGDSFASGQGIRDPGDRASGVLERRLGPGWSVLTIAQPGWDTGDQLAALQRVPFRPDAVVLLYFVNDVLGAAARFGFGLDLADKLAIRPAWLEPLVSHSHLANFAYWRVWRARNQEALGRAYRELLEQGFYRHDVWKEHTRELEGLLGYARREDAEFVALVIPILADVETSRKYTSRVVAFFERRDVPVIDLAESLRGRDPRELRVSDENDHANERVHAEMADLVYAELERLGAVGGASPEDAPGSAAD
jgi:hypothetical protein